MGISLIYRMGITAASAFLLESDVFLAGILSLGLFFPLLLLGPVHFFVMYKKYRDFNNRHHHEYETKVLISNLVTSDKRIKRLRIRNTEDFDNMNYTHVDGSLVENSEKNPVDEEIQKIANSW